MLYLPSVLTILNTPVRPPQACKHKTLADPLGNLRRFPPPDIGESYNASRGAAAFRIDFGDRESNVQRGRQVRALGAQMRLGSTANP